MDDVKALAARLRRLERMERARGLLHEYAAAVDQRSVESVAALFHPEAVLRNARGVFTGTAEIAGAFRTAWAAEPSQKRHFIATPKLAAQSDEIVGAAAHFLYVGRGSERSVIGWGAYDVRVDVADDERAVFRSMTITVHLSTDLATGWALDAMPG
ncbi:nuclear transport factor 2 family protein [Phytohabitans sp. ZYX-F-186]|uniref:Nuclear transport factor 2 family protein n=1 Tax=Phytohabitans maris TaxID=3071409 RepID=A0ABU0Z9R2_9ACTN|nr:nuclear transport factor 2 family protein [Phytohabitans sp. ZYX-F-186]MDQ7903778.1 nuclear transport factor 2 family protein [Phytohabitans sp. ZYX-F-186]